MKASWLLKGMAIASCIGLAVGCAKAPGTAEDYDNLTGKEVSSQGLGQFPHFAGQAQGESYTTKAPHNQLYLFSYDNAILADKYIPSLEAQAAYLKGHPGARVLVAGHTDERGSREYNVALGERRAQTVAEVLRNAGVNHLQLRIVSYGKERPINFNHDAGSHAQNRRVELTYESTR